MKLCTTTTSLIQLNNYLLYFPPDCVGQMVTALPDDEGKEILYYAMPNSWRKKMTEQVYNYLEKSIQDVFETWVEYFETPSPPPAVKRLPRKKSNSKKQKTLIFEDSDKDSSEDEKPQVERISANTMEKLVIPRTNVLNSRP